LDKLIERVGELVEMSPEEIMERRKVEARSILCYCATDSLGISQGELAKRLKLTQPAVSQAARRGKDPVQSQSYSLFDD
jgi:DNA-binding MarR family transcriptional regulator